MKLYWKTLVGLLVALPMLSYVAGTLVAAQQQPPQYTAIVLRPAQAAASSIAVLDATDAQDLPVLTPTAVEAVTPGPDDLDDDSDDAGRDGRNDDDSSGDGSRGGDDDSSGPRKDDDDDKSGSGSDDDDDDDDTDDPDEPDDPDDPDEPDEPDVD